MKNAKKRYSNNITPKAACPVILTVLFIFLILAIPACSNLGIGIPIVQEVLKKREPEIEEIVVCKNVDQDFAPVEAADVFPSGTNSIYLSVKFNNFTKDNSIKVIWSYTTLDDELAVQEFKPEESGSGYYSFNIKIGSSFPQGNYNVKVYFDNNLLKSSDFLIE